MYFDAIQNLGFTSKLAPGVPQSSFDSLPLFDAFSQNLQNLLPQNFSSFNTNGILQVLNPSNLNKQINNNATSLSPSIETQVTDALNAVKGSSPIYSQGGFSEDNFNQVSKELQSSAQSFSINNNNMVENMLSQNININQVGDYNNVVRGEIDKFNSLTPKGIRDLNDHTVFNNKVTSSTNNITNQLAQKSLNQTNELQKNPTFSDSAQNNLQQVSTPKFSGDNREGFDLYVRRTVYWAQGPATDIDSANNRSSTGRKLQEGISVAVDPNIIPYLSTIVFDDIGVRYATDTGGAVIGKVASKGTAPIIDVFFQKREDALAFANNSAPYVKVKVYPPQTKYKYAKNSSPTYGIA